MKRSCAFYTICALDPLESRVVLSVERLEGLIAVVSGLSPHLKVLNRKQQAMEHAEIQQAFCVVPKLIMTKPGQRILPRSQSQASPDAATTDAFTLYTILCCLCSGQQLCQYLHPVAGRYCAKAQGQPYRPQIGSSRNKVIGPQVTAPQRLACRVAAANDSAGGHFALTSSLYTLTQDNAIQTAEVAVLNGLSITKNGAFGIQKVSQY